MHIAEILDSLNIEYKGYIQRDMLIEDLLFDSRRLNSADNTMFFAINTPSDSGNKYIAELYSKGVRVFVVDNETDIDISIFPKAGFILSDNVIKTLQDIAYLKRKAFNKSLIAITGSNGKTIVKDWIVQVAGDKKRLCYSPRSYNSQIGVPLSIWNLSNKCEVGVFEAGISKPNEMINLERILSPDIGVFTNIGDAHQSHFSSIEEKIREKLVLFQNSKILIYPNYHRYLDQEIRSYFKDNKIKLIPWGYNEDASFRIERIEKVDRHTRITYIYNSIENSFRIRFTDKANIENSINTYIACLCLGIEEDYLTHKIEELIPIEMRLELKEGINNNIIINDAYSFDIMSLEIALDFLVQQSNDLKKTVILSDPHSLDNSPEEVYSSINSILNNKSINRLIGIGPGFSKYSSMISLEKEIYKSSDEFMKESNLSSFHNEIILIKGSRKFRFEKITRFFEKKAHETQLEINLSAIIHNTNYFKSKLKPETKLMAMVKALSYGCGGVEIASTLASHNIDYLAVAFADEGVELRNNGIKLPIMVMSPKKEGIQKIIQYNLEPEVYSINILNKIIIALNQYKRIRNIEPIIIHIKLDTGMHRLGIERKDIYRIIDIIKSNPILRIGSVFSHFSAADQPGFDEFTREQIKEFDELSSIILNSFDYKIIRHISNTAGISRFPEAHFDMVRLGIGMYGIGIDNKESDELRYVHRLKTNITQIKEILPNDSVGYSRACSWNEKRRIGIIPIGYADGLPRKRGNGRGRVYVNGSLAPIIGNICMDMAFVDLTGLDVSEGDDIIIFGEEYPAENIAKELDTIVYEVFTSVSTRVKRVFYQE